MNPHRTQRRIATRFALAGALAAVPIAALVGAAPATAAAIHHQQFGESVPLGDALAPAPGPQVVPTTGVDTTIVTLTAA